MFKIHIMKPITHLVISTSYYVETSYDEDTKQKYDTPVILTASINIIPVYSGIEAKKLVTKLCNIQGNVAIKIRANNLNIEDNLYTIAKELIKKQNY